MDERGNGAHIDALDARPSAEHVHLDESVSRGESANRVCETRELQVQLVEDSGRLPVAIVRPSIIGAIWREPIPGWTDNLNGPTGIFVGVWGNCWQWKGEGRVRRFFTIDRVEFLREKATS
jgi:hypothetical protein